MCGIFGYVGKRPKISSVILNGLKKLEYRGYDSWGISVKNKGILEVEKHTGKIENARIRLPGSNLGIGHTRWATHGKVTTANAHPHLDCTGKIALVHNGIIENFQELKRVLAGKGHIFQSETDTEVAVHLIEEYVKKDGFAISVRQAFQKLKGLNAIVACYAPSAEIVAAKNGSPLIVGVGRNEFFIASDATGIVDNTKKVVFLNDHQMAILGMTLKIIQLKNGKQIKPQVTLLDWKFEKAKKGKFKHFLLKEIHEQPKVIEHIAYNHSSYVKQLAKLVNVAFGTFMVGCGTASYAALAGTYLFSSVAKKHVNFTIGSEFNYLEDYLTPDSLIVAFSQSGETIDVIEPVSNAKRRGAKIAVVVNTLGSTLYRQADYKFLLGAGPEKAVVATKSFIAKIALLILTAHELSDKQSEGKKLLVGAAKNVVEILKKRYVEKIQALAKELKNVKHIYLIGRGLSYVSCLEAALKIKETSYTHAEGFAGGELKHGAIALIEKGTPCIVFAPNDETYEAIASNAQELKARGGFIVGIGPRDNSVFDRFFKTANLKHATMIPQIVIAQLLAYHLAISKGISDPDKPRNLAKSVTVR
ncbi:glutamine--fructose-6-phosphate transaminase (isomerizing) [Candidatus Roizmanbacteria bacterium]|nr:glutamine--fructose-6-phosphate transaminase (isomerizing) [Candidatus Roizmanbacteria bacterium]